MINFLHQTHYHSSWRLILEQALGRMDEQYLEFLLSDTRWLPGMDKVFNAFMLPFEQVNYILLGESPYPRAASANGYAFWDQSVGEIWSTNGLSKSVNRATSLRNFIKMLLVAAKKIPIDKTTPQNIAKINKDSLIETNQELFEKLLASGFLLLNASLTLDNTSVRLSSKQWKPFLREILLAIQKKRPIPTLILLGNVAKHLADDVSTLPFPKIIAEHPYNLSFISRPDVIQLFKPLNLLQKV
ncbi:MAG: uracil-DNA glycosylase [Gammaproteobacteria bacterium]|nr:uracil-DNA glycosylase [Gammaproteobacteria bacterium]